MSKIKIKRPLSNFIEIRDVTKKIKKKGGSGKKKNPFEKPTVDEITLPEVKAWMLKYIKMNRDYDPRDMVDHAIIHLNIVNVTPEHKKILRDLAYKTADDYEMRR